LRTVLTETETTMFVWVSIVGEQKFASNIGDRSWAAPALMRH
jgi:hypothetical protein